MFSHQRSLFHPWQLPTIVHSHSHSCNQNLNTKLKIRELPFADMFNLFASIIFPPWVGNAGPESGYCLLLVIGNTQCWGHIHTAKKSMRTLNISKILYVSQIWLSSNWKNFKERDYNEAEMRWSRKKIELCSLWFEIWKYRRLWTTKIMTNSIREGVKKKGLFCSLLLQMGGGSAEM